MSTVNIEAEAWRLLLSGADTPDCYDCGRQWADCTCEGPQT